MEQTWVSFPKEISTLDDLFVHMLQDIYYAEQEILKALPSMIKKATNSQLKLETLGGNPESCPTG
jgi:Domain of unknown function (DUF892)